MSPQRSVNTWLVVVLSVVVIVGVIGAAGYYFYTTYIADNRWKPLLQKQLAELVLKSSDSLYHIEYSGFDLNTASGNATLHNFKLMPDTGVYNKLAARKKAPDNIFVLSVKKLSLKNIGARKAYQQKILDIDDITIDKPALTIINKKFDYNDTVKVGRAKSPYQLIKKVFKQLHIDSVSLNDISLNYINKNGPQIKRTGLRHLDIHISDIRVDSLSGNDQGRFFYTKDINVTVHNYQTGTPDGLYKAGLKKIFFSTSQRQMVLDGISLAPRYNHTDFYIRKGEGGDIYDLKFKRIAIGGIDLQRFLRNQQLYANTMDINRPEISIYSNNAYKGKKTSKIGKDPQQALQKVALDMRLKRLNIKNADIKYSETDATTGATGEIDFTHTNGYFLNVTNDLRAKRNNPYMTAHINTTFMDVAPLQVNFRFDLASPQGAFNYSGLLGAFDGRILDKLVKPLAMVHVQSADIQKLEFNIDASNYGGKGYVDFYYKNLKLQLLKKVQGKDELQKQGLISLLANNLIIESNNPGKNGVFRPGPVDIKREPTISFFSFLYKGLLDGLKPAVGFDKKTEGKVNTAITKVSNLIGKFKQFKEDRKERREERKRARQAKRDSIKASKQNTVN